MYKFIKLCCLLVLLLTSLESISAASNVVLSEQAFSYVGQDGHLVIQFLKPMGYISHSPAKTGKLIILRLRDLFPSQPSFNVSERLTVPKHQNAPIADIVYNQDNTTTGELTIQLTREIEYNIELSRDRKRLTLVLHHIHAPVEGRSIPKGLGTDLPVYALNLLSLPTPIDPAAQPALVKFNDYDVYVTTRTTGNQRLYTLHLGYFYSYSNAKANLSRLRPFYTSAWIGEIPKNRRVIAENWLFNRQIKNLKKQKRVVRQKPEKIDLLLKRARQAMIDKDYPQAIRYFTRIQELADKKYQRVTLELLGLARERNGQFAHAKAEYEEYIRLYPEGEDTDRVRQRLLGLLTSRSTAKEKLKQTAEIPEPKWESFGSLFQFYRRQVTTSDSGPSIDTDNSISTDLIFSSRKRGFEYDQRLNISASHRYNFLESNTREQNNGDIYTFQYDISRRDGNFATTVGRQTHSSDGVLGRFDGLKFSKSIGTRGKLNFLTGHPVELSLGDSINTDRTFYAISFDVLSLFSDTDLKLYYFTQDNHRLTDRNAIGTEIKFISNNSSLFFIADYDTFYSSLNQSTFVGTWRNEANSTINLVADYRVSPLLTTNNALIGQSVTNLDQLRLMFTDDEIYQFARDRSSGYKSLTLSASTFLSDDYQLNGDFTVASLDGTPASGGVDATTGTGTESFYGSSLVVTNLFTDSDISILGLRYSDTSTAKTTQLSFSSNFTLNSKWRINPRLIYDLRDDDNASTRSTLKPRLIVNYRRHRDLRFELDIGYETAETANTTATTTEDNLYIYLGYIYDF